ncbi:hypothetical protein BIW11_12190 [Tropilaelaps mercedesae]|uniref:Uncharacterized protein n=1 Tax=Tropilaelaps mercedesae TaxID=418985 RepID=A0A1V9X840_9ACAR|nr:hypothetical protein BIW11_12190 [Tropilaelaps mercedesae]
MHLSNIRLLDGAPLVSRSSVMIVSLLIAFSVPLSCTTAPADDPECTLTYLDKCGKDIFLWTIANDQATAPSNAEELATHCERQAESEACVRKRSAKCHTNIVKGFSRLLYDAIHEEYEQRCDPASDLHASYLRMAPCINKMSPDMYNCTIRFIASTQSTTQSSHGKSLREKIPRACCSFAAYVHCAETSGRKHCDEETANFVKQYMEKTSGELLSFACGSYSAEADVCKKFLSGKPKSDEELLANFQASGVKSMLGALSKLSESLQASRG